MHTFFRVFTKRQMRMFFRGDTTAPRRSQRSSSSEALTPPQSNTHPLRVSSPRQIHSAELVEHANQPVEIALDWILCNGNPFEMLESASRLAPRPPRGVNKLNSNKGFSLFIRAKAFSPAPSYTPNCRKELFRTSKNTARIPRHLATHDSPHGACAC